MNAMFIPVVLQSDDLFFIISFVCIITIIVCRVLYQVYVRKARKSLTDITQNKVSSTFKSLTAVMANLRADLAAKESRIASGQSILTREVLESRRAMLDSAAQQIHEAESKSDLQEQAKAVNPLAFTALKAAIEINSDTTKELQAIITEAEGGGAAVAADAVAQLRELAASAQSSLEEGRTSTELTAANQAFQQGRKALKEAAALTKVLGLRVVNPV